MNTASAVGARAVPESSVLDDLVVLANVTRAVQGALFDDKVVGVEAPGVVA